MSNHSEGFYTHAPRAPRKTSEYITMTLYPKDPRNDFMRPERVEFANIEKTGISKDLYFYKNERIDDTKPPAEIADLMCIFCTELPYIPRRCSVCKSFGCKACFNEAARQRIGCHFKPQGRYQSRGYEAHELEESEDIIRPFKEIRIECKYGCKIDSDSQERRRFGYIGAMRHYAQNGCPSSICNTCKMYQYGEPDEAHLTPDKCIENLRRFSTYLYMKYQCKDHELKEWKRYTETLERTFKTKIESLEKTNRQLRDVVEIGDKYRKNLEKLVERGEEYQKNLEQLFCEQTNAALRLCEGDDNGKKPNKKPNRKKKH